MDRADGGTFTAPTAGRQKSDLGKRTRRTNIPVLDDLLLSPLHQSTDPLADAVPKKVPPVAGPRIERLHWR
jgi:hypothetical protein